VEFRADVVAKQEAFANHKREIEHTTGHVNHHRKDINEISVDMRMVLKRLDRLEKKVLGQQETIDALEGIMENQQGWIARLRVCRCDQGADQS